MPRLSQREIDDAIRTAMVHLGRRTSPKKAAAARRNGRKGGRPRLRKR